jgi:hypothetical protein
LASESLKQFLLISCIQKRSCQVKRRLQWTQISKYFFVPQIEEEQLDTEKNSLKCPIEE